MDTNVFWLALGLVLVIEGLFPFASPGGWRRMFAQLLRLQDGQIRFVGMLSIALGLLVVLITSS